MAAAPPKLWLAVSIVTDTPEMVSFGLAHGIWTVGKLIVPPTPAIVTAPVLLMRKEAADAICLPVLSTRNGGSAREP